MSHRGAPSWVYKQEMAIREASWSGQARSLQDRINNLEKENEELKTRIKELEKENKKLKMQISKVQA